MGIIIQGNFTSPEGFTYTSFYLRITAITVNLVPPTAMVSVSTCSYLSRELYLSGANPINVTTLPTSYGCNIPIQNIDSISLVSYVYYLITNSTITPLAQKNAFQLQPVIEPAQSVFEPEGTLVYTTPNLSSTDPLRAFNSITPSAGSGS